MDNGVLVTESAGYAKEALWGRWTRWLIFVICSLPFALVPFVFDPEKLFDGTNFRWELVPWDQLAALVIAGFLLSFVISGYLARVYRGVKPSPGFDNWGALYVDGIRIAITGFLWFVPVLLAAIGMILVLVVGFTEGSTVPLILTLAVTILLLIVMVILGVIALLYSMMGIVRCARAGSIREGIRFSAITETLRAIGWVNYIVALIVLVVIGFVFVMAMSLITLIPYAGWIVELVVTPFYTIFAAWYLSRVYDHGMPQGPVEPVAVVE